MDRVAYNAMLAQYTTPEVSGDGRVSLDKGVRCVMPSVKLYGKCQQDTLTGKNLLNLSGRASNPNVVTGAGQITNFNGNWIFVGYSRNGEWNESTVSYRVENDYVSLKQWYFGYGIGFDLKVTPSTQYSIRATCAESCYVCATFYDSDGNLISYKQSESTLLITTPENAEWMIFSLNSNTLQQFNEFREIQVELGSTATAYEPYCGGIPAPNPSYPVPIKCNNGVYRAADAAGEYDGGQAQAPELWAIPDTEYRDEWDAQTGQGVRRCAIIESYAGESITTPYISSTGELSEGATVIYGIPDTPFYATPARLTMPPGAGQIIQVGGDVADCPISAKFLTHS